MSLSNYNCLQNIYKEYYRCSKEDNRYFYVRQVHLVSMSQMPYLKQKITGKEFVNSRLSNSRYDITIKHNNGGIK